MITDSPAGASPAAIVSADLNEDGVQDLVTSNGQTRDEDPLIAVALGDGNGRFVEHRKYPSGVGFYEAIVTADFDADAVPVPYRPR